MDTHVLAAYLPQDRRHALACGESLPDRTEGSALFADISGFTLLTEALARTLGPRRGAEELARQLNRVYDALIAEVERYGGSVIGFAGDAMTCWFDTLSPSFPEEGGGGVRAAACAVAMQTAMQAFAQVTIPSGETVALAMKAAIASGPARRFVVGDGDIQLLDVLAGATLDRVAAAERLAGKGQVIVDEPTFAQIEAGASVREWRAGASGERFAIISNEPFPIATPTPQSQIVDLQPDTLCCWLLPAVYERLQAGAGEFLTELRPAVAVFVNFTGIDYDADEEAGRKLDAYLQWVQQVVGRYDGALLQVTMGDKGSFLYAAFGALTAHEDDARRALLAALELREPPTHLTFTGLPHIGVSLGVMRVGAYGGTTRRTYGAIGDDTNLAARLMQAAAPGQIILSAPVHAALKGNLVCQPLPPLRVKGKSKPIAAWALQGVGHGATVELHEPAYTLPMVGRESELALVGGKFALVLQGHGQIVGITAEAGLGKSRLVAEIIRLVTETGRLAHSQPAIYAGACQSFGTNIAYLVWRDIWRSLFRLEPAASVSEQICATERALAQIDPAFVQRAPLLGLVLDIPIPDNDLTRSFDAKLRKQSLEALLVDCFKALAHTPLVLVLEDLHWLDPLSHDLLEAIGRVIANLPVLIVLAYRPPELTRLQAGRVMGLPHATTIRLNEFTPPEAGQLIALKLAQLNVPGDAALFQSIKHKIVERAQGNPFFIEEILNYVQDKALDWNNPQAVAQLEWPDSLHTLILSRIDQLTEHEKMTLKVASIIGRVFRVAWLHGYYPALGDMPLIKADLDELHRLDITPQDTPEPELAYLFRHIVTQEVTYESLPYATRAQLHELLARYLEMLDAGDEYIDRYLNLLAFHYSRSENIAKQREYLHKAGAAAQKNFANAAALDYYGQLLPLLPEVAEQFEIHLKRGQVLELMGAWDEAEADYRAALVLAGREAAMTASAQLALGKLCRQRGDYEAALAWLVQAQEERAALGERVELAQVSIETGRVLWHEGEYAAARGPLKAGLALAREASDKRSTALALNDLGNVAFKQGDYAAARALYEDSLALRREVGDKWGMATLFINLGNVASAQGDYAAARALYADSLALKREIGDKWGIALSLVTLGLVAYVGGDYTAVRAPLEDSLALCQEMDEKYLMAYALLGLGLVGLAEHALEAREYLLNSLRLRREMGAKFEQTSSLVGLAGLAMHTGDARHAAYLLGAVESALQALDASMEAEVRHLHAQTLAAARAALGEEAFNAAWAEGEEMTLEEAVADALAE